MHHVEGRHEHLPDRIAQGAFQHLVGMVDDRSLGDADVSDFAFPLLRIKHRYQYVERIFVVVKSDAMEIEHVDMLDAHDAQRTVDAGNKLLRRYWLSVATHPRTGADHDLMAMYRCEATPGAALGAIGGRRVDEVDAEIDSFEDEAGSLAFRFAGF